MEYTENEQEIINQLSEGEMTYVEYIKQHDQSFRAEYAEYCHEYGYDEDDESAAMSFIELQEEILDESLGN